MKKIFFICFMISCIAIIVTGCSKGGGSINQPPTPVPTLTVTATPDTTWYSGTAMINWTSTNATSVSMQGGSISGISGSFTTPALITPATYTIKATGNGGSTTKSITISVYSERMTLWCNYGPVHGNLFRVCREDSIAFPSAWHDKPELIDCNSIKCNPDGTGSVTMVHAGQIQVRLFHFRFHGLLRIVKKSLITACKNGLLMS